MDHFNTSKENNFEITEILIPSPLNYHEMLPANSTTYNPMTKYDNSPEITEEAAYQVFQLLQEWGFSFLYKLFLAERLDVDALKILTTDHLLNLCSTGKMQLGIAIRFEAQLKNWQIMQGTTISTASTMTSDKLSTNDVFLPNILRDSPKGRLILQYYNTHDKLNDLCRASILEIINNFLIQNEIKMSCDLAKNISQQIIDEFPNEDLDMYYIKQPGKPAISKVSAKYYNAQRNLKNCGILGKRVYESRSSKERKIRNELSLSLEPEENHQESLKEIMNDNCSFAELESHWVATKNYRATDVASIEANCSEILKKWPHYKKPLGYKLIDIDFKNLYPNARGLSDGFDTFSHKVLPILQNKIKDCHNTKILENITKNSCISENAKQIGILYLLHNLIPPVSKEACTSTSKNQFTKFSIKDSQNSVFVFGETAVEVEEIINKKIQQNSPVQPFIIVMGSIEEPKEFIVYFDGIKYKLSSILNSIDCCFKIYNFFNLQYPNQSILYWNFLQQYMFNITTTIDKYHPSISTLVKRLNE